MADAKPEAKLIERDEILRAKPASPCWARRHGMLDALG